MVTKLQFIMYYSIFLFAVMQLSAMAGSSIVTGAGTVSPPSVPNFGTIPAGTGIAGFFTAVINLIIIIGGIIGFLIANIGYFFALMGASSTFALFGSFILAPLGITVLWIILEFLRGT